MAQESYGVEVSGESRGSFSEVNGKRPRARTTRYLSSGIAREHVETGRDSVFDPQPLGQTAARSGSRRKKGPDGSFSTGGPPLPRPSSPRLSSSNRRKSLECRRFLAPCCVFSLLLRAVGSGFVALAVMGMEMRTALWPSRKKNMISRWFSDISGWGWTLVPRSTPFWRGVVEEELWSFILHVSQLFAWFCTIAFWFLIGVYRGEFIKLIPFHKVWRNLSECCTCIELFFFFMVVAFLSSLATAFYNLRLRKRFFALVSKFH